MTSAARPVESRDPATGETWRSYPVADRAAVAAALATARDAQAGWARLPTRTRARALERFRRVLYTRRHEVADVIQRENGKVAAEALVADVIVTLDLARYYAKRSARVLAPERFTPSNLALWRKRVMILHEPFGVVGVISPWNYPLMLAASVLLPAIVAGNGVLFKPSEFTPTTGVLLGEMLAEAGVPAGLVQVLTGDGSTGAAVAESGVDKVFFTGSAATGRRVAHACAERLVPCQLELGGSDPAIVLADADLEVAASGILWGRFSNAGQTCVAPKRVFVEDAAYDRFVEVLGAKARALTVGAAAHPERDVGPMIRPQQLAHLAGQLDDALARGARTVSGGAPAPDAAHFAPTVLVDVREGMRVLHEETFGPLLPVQRVSSAEEAVRLANASSFGLSASVWGRDLTRATAVAHQIEAGTVVINDAITIVGIAEVPHGGVKESGYGRSHGTIGLLECTRTKAIVTDYLPWLRQPWWFGYSAAHAANIDAFARLSHGATWRERLSGVRRSVAMLFRQERPV